MEMILNSALSGFIAQPFNHLLLLTRHQMMVFCTYMIEALVVKLEAITPVLISSTGEFVMIYGMLMFGIPTMVWRNELGIWVIQGAYGKDNKRFQKLCLNNCKTANFVNSERLDSDKNGILGN